MTGAEIASILANDTGFLYLIAQTVTLSDNRRDTLPETAVAHSEMQLDMAQQIAAAFVSARRSACPVDTYPGTPPADFDDAYAIQNKAIALDGRSVAGWKVGRVQEPLATELGTTRLAGPIFADSIIHAADGTVATMPVFAGGFAAVEAELLLRVAQSHADPASLDDAGILALVDAVHVGIEIASSPYAQINAMGPLVTASDFGNNAGLVVGPTLPDWQSRDLSNVFAQLSINDAEQGEGDMAGLPGGPLESVRFLLANLQQRGLGGAEPLWVSAGAITGVHVILPGAHAVARFDGHLTVACRTIAAAGR